MKAHRPVDDPQLRVDPGCRPLFQPVHGADGCFAFGWPFPAQLHCVLLAVLGSECARCELDGPQTRGKTSERAIFFFPLSYFLYSEFMDQAQTFWIIGGGRDRDGRDRNAVFEAVQDRIPCRSNIRSWEWPPVRRKTAA